MLEIKAIKVVYGKVILILRDVSLNVPTGSITALLGGNGAGKSTTLKAISGLLASEEGEIIEGSITFNGEPIHHKGAASIVRSGIAQVMEGRMVLGHLTVEQNLSIGAYIRGDRAGIKRDIDMIYAYFPELKILRRKLSGYLSGGEQQMLVIGRAMMSNPKLMLLDEPSMGLAPLLMKEIFRIVKQINDEHKTSFLLVEQNARLALSVASYGYVMENGKVVLSDTAENLINSKDVQEFYLGLGSSGEKKDYRDGKSYKRKKTWLGS